MARKKRGNRDNSSTATTQGRSIVAPGWLIWCIAIWMMLLAKTPFAFVEQMQLVPLPDQSLLSQSRAWNPPFAYIAAEWQINAVPYWLGALLTAVLLATSIRWQAASENMVIMAVGAVGLVLVSQPFPLSDLLCILLVAYLIKRRQQIHDGRGGRADDQAETRISDGAGKTEWKLYASAIIAFFISVLISLEFGLIAILMTCSVVGPQIKDFRESRMPWNAIGAALIWFLLICLPGLFIRGYFAAMLRPFSWAWLDTPATLLPSMVPLWQTAEWNGAHALLLLPIAERWWQAIVGKLPFFDTLNLGIFTWMGVGCVHYLWLVAAAIVMTGRSNMARQETKLSTFSPRYAQSGWLVLGVAMLGVAIQVTTNGATILASDMIRRVIDPTQWNLRGTVLLSNLEQSSRWQQPQRRRQYELLLTDRWDVHHSIYSDYAATLEDWSNWRREAYRREDGKWGGYQSRFSEWEPRLVVIDTSELSAIHRVSLDSKWKVIAIDHKKSVFLSNDVPQNRSMIQHAGRILSTLELPRPGAETDFQRVLALGSPADSKRVSGVLTALRLPYAALRVLPDDRQPSTRTAAVFAWCELAHRSKRYSGQYSLLDCSRALSATKLTGPSSLVEQTNRYREALTAAVRQDVATVSSMAGSTAASGAESKIRQHLLLGETARATEQSEKLSDAARTIFYTTIAESLSLSTAECMERLETATQNLTGERNAECWFYIGCLAIESGDFLRAQEAFANVSERSSPSPFATIADFYLTQL